MVNPEGTPLIQSEKATKWDSLIAYRTWPIFLLSFIRLFFISIFERAFLNYLYFSVDINESTLGLISSATAAAYIIGPLVGQFITLKLGIRNSIILSSISTPILMSAQMISQHFLQSSFLFFYGFVFTCFFVSFFSFI